MSILIIKVLGKWWQMEVPDVGEHALDPFPLPGPGIPTQLGYVAEVIYDLTNNRVLKNRGADITTGGVSDIIKMQLWLDKGICNLPDLKYQNFESFARRVREYFRAQSLL